MAGYMGKDGYVTVGGSTVAYLDTWSLNPSIGTADVTGFGNTSRVYEQTIRDASLSMGGTMDRSDAEQATLFDQFEDGTLADVAVRLYVLPATYWSGNVRLTGMTVNSAVADKVSVTWNGVVNGNLAYTSS